MIGREGGRKFRCATLAVPAYRSQMRNVYDVLFRTLADPTRRALFERLCREGEQTVGALTVRAGVSQPAVSKHLGVLKQAGLVRDRHEGRHTHYSAQLGALAPLIDWTSQMARFWQSRFDPPRRSAQKDGPMTNTATETLSVVVEREMPFPPEKTWTS
jgi:DNA-binding transcriptional ArsR family regulator